MRACACVCAAQLLKRFSPEVMELLTKLAVRRHHVHTHILEQKVCVRACVCVRVGACVRSGRARV